MLNLPINSYPKNSPDSAVSDSLNYSVYNIPNEDINLEHTILYIEFGISGMLIQSLVILYKKNKFKKERREIINNYEVLDSLDCIENL